MNVDHPSWVFIYTRIYLWKYPDCGVCIIIFILQWNVLKYWMLAVHTPCGQIFLLNPLQQAEENPQTIFSMASWSTHFVPLARFSRNLAWVMCHWRSCRNHRIQLITISNKNGMDSQICVLGGKCNKELGSSNQCSSICAPAFWLGST
jgi:hypothetical protein